MDWWSRRFHLSIYTHIQSVGIESLSHGSSVDKILRDRYGCFGLPKPCLLARLEGLLSQNSYMMTTLG
jgi:hypothetical protein